MPEERLQKVLAAAGVASRRQCEALIVAGRVQVNGRVESQLGVRVDSERDAITLDGQPIVRSTQQVYLAFNKPRGYLTTAADDRGRATVFDLLGPSEQRVYTVGRLDRDSEGLLLFTNDGELAFRMTHPRYELQREYRVLLAGNVSAEGVAVLRAGVEVEGRHVAPRLVEVDADQRTSSTDPLIWLRVILTEGRKREIRALCIAAGYGVQQLVRVRYGPLGLGNLPTGATRPLTVAEVAALKRAVGLGEDGR